jgi:hypothetical protein
VPESHQGRILIGQEAEGVPIFWLSTKKGDVVSYAIGYAIGYATSNFRLTDLFHGFNRKS